MPYVYVDAVDLLDELTDQELLREVAQRKMGDVPEFELKRDLTLVWEEIRGKPAPDSLRKLMWEVIGKVL